MDFILSIVNKKYFFLLTYCDLVSVCNSADDGNMIYSRMTMLHFQNKLVIYALLYFRTNEPGYTFQSSFCGQSLY